MSEQPTQPPTAEQPGPLTRLVERVAGHVEPEAKHIEAAAAGLTTEAKAFLTDHASTVYDVTGDLIAAIKMIDPADGAALTAFQALLPKVVGMAGNVSSLLASALKAA